jgi:hypothetical protein
MNANENSIISVEVDTMQPELLQLTSSVTKQIVEESGPGGGWPVVRLTGPAKEVFKILREQYDLDDDSIAYMVGGGE